MTLAKTSRSCLQLGRFLADQGRLWVDSAWTEGILEGHGSRGLTDKPHKARSTQTRRTPAQPKNAAQPRLWPLLHSICRHNLVQAPHRPFPGISSLAHLKVMPACEA